ncbi:MAG: hypothetical protein IKX24_04790 [Prevotella sp.]|nr:hypothetical protein [Prevotella sp.]
MHKKDILIIVLIFTLYIIGYAWLIEPKKEVPEREEEKTVMQLTEEPQTRTETKRKPKSLSADWPLDLGKYFYTIDIDPGYEMEDEEYEVVGKSGGNLIVRKHNDWPAISGHFEWFCNEKLTTTQQMYDYVVSHHKAILRQMQEVKRRGLSRVFDEASYYQDYYEDYQDDPEDEIRFPPEIFDANDE